MIQILKRSMQPRFLWFYRWLGKQRIVVKDVHTCLALAYFAQTIHPHQIILLRHPCALASSWASLNLEVRFRIELLLKQPSLIEAYLEPFQVHLRQTDEYFFNVGAYWGASYWVMLAQARQHPEWQIVTHEWLCVNSASRFRQLLIDAGIDVDNPGQRSVEQFLNSNNRRRKDREGAHSTARLTTEEPDKWKYKLTSDQIEAVLAGAKPFGILERYYSEAQGTHKENAD